MAGAAPPRQIRHCQRVLLLVALLAALLSIVTAPTAAADSQRRNYTGVLDGAEYKVEVPNRWNGTLVLYSHGYFPPVWPPPFIQLANRFDTERWLLDHGYALAASKFQGDGSGFLIKEGHHDQIKLLDWFEANVGRPRHTVSYGMSLGAPIATLLAERYPHRFDGIAAVCGTFDTQGQFNAVLDINFAVRTLLTSGKDAAGNDIDLVRPRDAVASTEALLAGITRAVETPQGRARLALAASLNNVTGWYDAHQPRPVTDEERIRQQTRWIHDAYVGTLGPLGRVDLERRAGGNPSWNVGVDYGRQLARSDQTELVRVAYRDAGLDLDADLAALARAPRIAPDPSAVGHVYRYGVPRGTTPSPMITIHTTGDGGAVPDTERSFAEQVRRSGDPAKLRQLFVTRGAHCSTSAAEEITMLTALFQRIETGRWPDTRPGRLNAAANSLGASYHNVLDLVTGVDSPEPPSFTRFDPPAFLRPSR